MKDLLKYFKGLKKECILAPFFKCLEAAFELIVPLIVANIINCGIADKSVSQILGQCGILLLLGAVGLAAAVTAQYFAAKAAVGFSASVRSELFKSLQSLSYTEIDSIGTPTMITRMTSDINQVQNGVNMVLRLFLRSPIIVFGALIMAFTVDVKCGIIFACAIPVLAIIVMGITKITIPMYRSSQNKLDKVYLSTKENLVGARVIRAFCKEADEEELFYKRNLAYTKNQKFVSNISAIMNPATFAVVNVAVILIMYFGGLQVNSGALSQGEVVALYNYMSQIIVELIKLSNLIVTLTKTLACANRISAVLKIKNSLSYIDDKTAYSDSEVEFENVSMKYNSASHAAIDGITFRADKNQTIGIIGGTASGKTTLVNLIPHFYDCTEGRVLLCGRDVRSYTPEEINDMVGIVPQNAVLFNGTIRENIKWGNNNASDEECMEATRIAQAEDVLNVKGGLDGRIEQGGKNLSGGQKQRLTIARAVVKKPKILILDDSASALDYATDAALRKAVKNIQATVFIVSQRTSSIQGADKIIVLDNGKAVGIGTHKELLKTCAVYKEIYDSQFKE